MSKYHALLLSLTLGIAWGLLRDARAVDFTLVWDTEGPTCDPAQQRCADTFRVKWGQASRSYTNQADTREKTYTVRNWPEGEPFYAVVIAVDAQGEFHPTNEIALAVPNLVTSITPQLPIVSAAPGVLLFSDRTYTLQAPIPAVLGEGAMMFQPANANKLDASATAYTITFGRDALLWLGYDSRQPATGRPGWLRTTPWQDAQATVQTTDVPFALYRRAVRGGEVVALAGNRSDGGLGNTHYLIFVTPPTVGKPYAVEGIIITIR